MEALQKVGQTLEIANTNQSSGPSRVIEDLLRDNMLGIISYINDLLQDVQGKKLPTAKQAILRALGVFIKYIGPPICNIAPQVYEGCRIFEAHFFTTSF
jgi:serine/threonine-protein kinase ATR